MAIGCALAKAVSRSATSLAPDSFTGDWAKLEKAQTDSKPASLQACMQDNSFHGVFFGVDTPPG